MHMYYAAAIGVGTVQLSTLTKEIIIYIMPIDANEILV